MRKLINSTILKALFVVLIIIAPACTDNFERYNKPQDQPGDLPSYIKYGILLQNMQQQVIPAIKNRYQMNENLIGGHYGRYFSSSQLKTKWGGSGTFINYNPPAKDWATSPFDMTMSEIYSSWIPIKNMSQREGMPYAWAQVIRIAAMHRLTDMQGPIPYTLMGEVEGYTTAYDAQEDVYMAMFEDLDAAIEVLSNYATSSPEDRIYEDYDLIYLGDVSKWVKLANSLKLRMAMRISLVNPTKAQEYAEAALNHVYGVITTNSDNAAIDYKGAADKNPLRQLVEVYEDVVAGAEIVTYMQSYSDPRLELYFAKSTSGGVFAGLRAGAASETGWGNSYSWPKVKETDKVMWISASEVAFLRAEMALNGWNAGGTAQALYEEAITLSFTQNGLSATDAVNYYTNSTLVPVNHVDARGNAAWSYTPSIPYSLTIAWDDTDVKEMKLEKIITQKWIALYPLGTEAWCEQRRTGYPRFYPSVDNKSAESGIELVGPSRIRFSPTESESTPETYEEAVRLLGGPDRFATKLWWDVKTNKPAW